MAHNPLNHPKYPHTKTIIIPSTYSWSRVSSETGISIRIRLFSQVYPRRTISAEPFSRPRAALLTTRKSRAVKRFMAASESSIDSFSTHLYPSTLILLSSHAVVSLQFSYQSLVHSSHFSPVSLHPSSSPGFRTISELAYQLKQPALSTSPFWFTHSHS